MNSIKFQNSIYSISINSGESKTSDSDPHRLLINFLSKINLKKSDRSVTLSNLSIYYILKCIKRSFKNSKFKISAPKWNEKFSLPDK